MHASQITATETISATMPLKVSAATRSSIITEGFGLRWRQDILAADASMLGQSPATAKGTSLNVKLNQAKQIGKAGTNAGEIAFARMAATVTQAEPSTSVAAVASVASDVASNLNEPLASAPAIAGGAVPVTTAWSSRPKHESKATGRTEVAEVVNLKNMTPLESAVVTSLGVQGNVPALSHVVQISQALAATASPAASSVPSGAKLRVPSTIALPGNEPPTEPGPTALKVLASEPLNHGIAIPAERPRNSTEMAAPSLAAYRSATGSSLNLVCAFPIANASQINQTDIRLTIPPTLPVNHAAPPSAQAELQAPTIAGTTAIRAFHILPSAPTELDVGVLDVTHGWLRIRAELGAGGAVSASLTASALAHESLRAALPEMAKYLGSEAVSVTSLAVHRFAAGSSTMSAAMEISQQNGEPDRHHPRGDETQEDRGARKDHAPASDQLATRPPTTTTTPMADVNSVDAPGSVDWIRGFSSGTIRQAWSFGALEGINGSWLNVCA